MNPHFFTAPFYFTLVQGSRGGFADFFRRWYSCIAALPEGADRAQAA